MIPSLPRRPALTALALLLALALGACGGGVRGESPFAQVSSWRIDGRDLALDLRLRNVNEEPLEVRALTLDVTVDDGVELFRHDAPLALEIAAGGFETVHLEGTASAAGTALLQRLAKGDVASLAYRLQGSVDSEDSGELTIEREGRIYTVPGRPNEFR